MHLSLPIAKSLLLLLPFQALSSPTPDPIPGTLATQNGPINVPAASLGGAIQTFGGSTRVYYQSLDGAIHELVGNSSPSPSRVYVDQIILPVGRARTATPIVVVDSGAQQIRIYYISPDDRLREWYYDRQWRDGNLNSANITTRSGSRYLWALLQPGPGAGANRGPRIGYVGTNGDLSEVSWDGDQWNKAIF